MPVKPTNYDEQYTGLLWGGATIGTVTGGDLSGTLPNPTVTGINGITVLGTPTDGQELVYSSASNAWIPESETVSGLSSITDGTTTVSPATSLQVPNQSLTNGGAALAIVRWDRLQTIAAAGAAQTLDLSLYDVFDLTLTANCTLTFTNPPTTGADRAWVFIIRQGGSGSYTITWPAAVKWPASDGTPTATPPALFTAVTAINTAVLSTEDGGTTYGANLVGSGSTSPLTAKGDVWGYATKDARIPVGPDGYFLMAQSIAPLGVSWQAPSMWMAHAHITGEPFTGDGSTVTFVLANEADIYDVAAYVAGSRTDVTVDATGHTVTFGTAPSNTAAIRIDYVAAVT